MIGALGGGLRNASERVQLKKCSPGEKKEKDEGMIWRIVIEDCVVERKGERKRDGRMMGVTG